MQHHEADHGTFPAGGWGWGWVGDADRGFGLGQPGGWIYNSLRYMDLQALHDMGIGTDPTGTNPTAAAKMAANSLRAATPLGGFICPTRRAVGPLSFHQLLPANHNKDRHGRQDRLCGQRGRRLRIPGRDGDLVRRLRQQRLWAVAEFRSQFAATLTH